MCFCKNLQEMDKHEQNLLGETFEASNKETYWAKIQLLRY